MSGDIDVSILELKEASICSPVIKSWLTTWNPAVEERGVGVFDSASLGHKTSHIHTDPSLSSIIA